MNTTDSKALSRHMSQLLGESLRIAMPLHNLHTLREKIEARGYQSFDREAILQELGQLQHLMAQLHKGMLHVHDTLKNI
jgi:hypothetical protein